MKFPLVLKISLAVQLLCLLTLLSKPSAGLFIFALCALVFSHIIVVLPGLLPRSTWLGRNILKIPAPLLQGSQVFLTFDDGPDPVVTPQVLDVLRAFDAKASFFCIGKKAQSQPDLLRRILLEGHQIGNHTWSHQHDFSVRGLWYIRQQIEDTQRCVESITGFRPLLFRPPAGLRNFLLYPVLSRLRLQHISWTRRGLDTRTPSAEKVLTRLSKNLRAGDILLLHDGHSAITPLGEPVVLAILPLLLAKIKSLGLECAALDARHLFQQE